MGGNTSSLRFKNTGPITLTFRRNFNIDSYGLNQIRCNNRENWPYFDNQGAAIYLDPNKKTSTTVNFCPCFSISVYPHVCEYLGKKKTPLWGCEGNCSAGFRNGIGLNYDLNAFPTLPSGIRPTNLTVNFTKGATDSNSNNPYSHVLTANYTFDAENVSKLDYDFIKNSSAIFNLNDDINKQSIDQLFTAFCISKPNTPICNSYCLEVPAGRTGPARVDDTSSFCYEYAQNFCTTGTNILDASGDFCQKAINPNAIRKYPPEWAEPFVVNTFCRRPDAFENPKYSDFCSCFKPKVNAQPSCTDGVCASKGFKNRGLIDQSTNCGTVCLQQFNIDKTGGNVIFDKNNFDQQCGQTLKEVTSQPGYTGEYKYTGIESITGAKNGGDDGGVTPIPLPGSGLNTTTILIIVGVIFGIIILLIFIYFIIKKIKKNKSNLKLSS